MVRTLAEASKLRRGDMLVCELTVPPWVPLFATVSAIVADSGGILSHCAIVAREFRARGRRHTSAYYPHQRWHDSDRRRYERVSCALTRVRRHARD